MTVVQAKKIKYAMLKPAPSSESVIIFGRISLIANHAIVNVKGLIAVIHIGKDVFPDATKTENKIDAIKMIIKTGA